MIKIIVERATDLVVYAARNVEIYTDRVKVGELVDRSLNSSNAAVYDVSELPRCWLGKCYTYSPGVGFSLVEERREWVEQRFFPELKEKIRALAYKKIVAVAPEWKQRNMMAHSITLLQKGQENWTPEEAVAAASYEAIWARIAAIRAYSNQLEETLTPDTDITAGWPE